MYCVENVFIKKIVEGVKGAVLERFCDADTLYFLGIMRKKQEEVVSAIIFELVN